MKGRLGKVYATNLVGGPCRVGQQRDSVPGTEPRVGPGTGQRGHAAGQHGRERGPRPSTERERRRFHPYTRIVLFILENIVLTIVTRPKKEINSLELSW